MSRFSQWFFSAFMFALAIAGLCLAWDWVTESDPRLHGQVTQYVILRLAALCLCLPAVVGSWLYIDSLTEADWFVWEQTGVDKKCSDLMVVVLVGKIVLLAVSLYVVGWILTSA
jgi:hypothetical protein